MTLEGRTFVYTYKSGLKVEGEFLASSRLRWRAMAGAAAGKTGEEAVSIVEVRPGLWFVSWVEAAGTTVSQTLDLAAMTVTNYVTFDTPGGRRGMLDTGTLEETKA